MNTDKDRIIYVHGMKPKPRPEDHRAMLWRCLLDGVRRVDVGVAEEMAGNPGMFALVAWSGLLYDQRVSIEPDVPVPANLVKLNVPQTAVRAADGTVYIADTLSNVIRRARDGQRRGHGGTAAHSACGGFTCQ